MSEKYYNHPSYIGFMKKDDDRADKYQEQYDKVGFDDSVTWSLDYSIAKFIYPRIVRFYEIAEEVINIDFHEGLREAIEAMIEGFALTIEDKVVYTDEEHEKMQKAWDKLAEYHNGLWW